jgi:membrane fusion protein (multidrug efflux system)
MTRSLKLAAYIIPIAMALSTYSCGKSGSTDSSKEDEKNPSVPVEVAEVVSGDIAAYFSGTATIEAEEETGVVAKVGGVVEELLVEEGDYVEKGQILATLDDELLRVQLDQSEANLKRLESIYQRNIDLHKKQLISTEEFQQSKFDYEQHRAAYELSELNLRYTSIRTPISGVVAERMIKVGNMVLQNSPVFRVTGLNPLIAVLHVPEKRLDMLGRRQRVTLRVDALGAEEFKGRIKRISPIVDPNTGTVKVTVEINDSSRRLMPGMFARVNIIHDVHENTVLVPKDAVISEDRESAVFVIRDSTAVRQSITLGFTNTIHVEVLSGLIVGDTVVTTGKAGLKDSTLVEIVKD